MPKITLTPNRQAALLLLTLLLIFLSPNLWGGQARLATDLIFEHDPLWRPLAPPGFNFKQPDNPVLADQVNQFYPWRVFIRQSLAQGSLPLWNPHTDGGHSFIGNAQSGLLNPLNWLAWLLPLPPAESLSTLLRLFIAGYCTYLFARQIDLSHQAGLLAMVTFTFSGPMIVWLVYPLSDVVTWFPAMLLTIERALSRNSRGYTMLCGGIIGLQFLAGHPETSFQLGLIWLIYALYRSRSWPDVGRIIVAGSLGVGLGMGQLLPFIEALGHSAILGLRQTEAAAMPWLTALLLDWHDWPTAITLLLPHYFGSPLTNSYWFPYSNYVEQTSYGGFLPLIFALSMMISLSLHIMKRATLSRLEEKQGESRIRPLIFWSMLTMGSLALALRLPLINGLNQLPLFDLAASGRLRIAFVFGLAILAAHTLDYLTTARRTLPALHPLLLGSALLCTMLGGVSYLGFSLYSEQLIASGREFMATMHGQPNFSRPLVDYYALAEARHQAKLDLFALSNPVMYLPLLLTAAYFGLRRLRVSLPYIVISLTTLDLFLIGMPFGPTIAPAQIFPRPAEIQFLQQDQSIYRVAGLVDALAPNRNLVFGLSDLRGYEPLRPRRIAMLMARLEGQINRHSHSLLLNARAPLLDLLNVKYLLSDQPPDDPARWQPIFSGPGLTVYENQQVLPRAFMVHQAEIINNNNETAALRRLLDPNFDFRQRVILEEQPPNWPPPTSDTPPPEPSTPAEVVITRYQPNRVEVAVQTAAPGILILSDNHMVGWHALLDGETVPLYVANYSFRGVVLPAAGLHSVTFVYQPLSVWVGLAISGVSLLILLGGGLRWNRSMS